MALYTFFLDYKGGTYVFQVTADDMTQAPAVWAEAANFGGVPDANFQGELRRLIETDTPVEIEGLSKTWCLSYIIANKLALVHFTETAH